jgi:hypothetical protein
MGRRGHGCRIGNRWPPRRRPSRGQGGRRRGASETSRAAGGRGTDRGQGAHSKRASAPGGRQWRNGSGGSGRRCRLGGDPRRARRGAGRRTNPSRGGRCRSGRHDRRYLLRLFYPGGWDAPRPGQSPQGHGHPEQPPQPGVHAARRPPPIGCQGTIHLRPTQYTPGPPAKAATISGSG